MVPDPCATEMRTGPSPMATEQSDGGMMPEAKSPPIGTNAAREVRRDITEGTLPWMAL